MRLIRLILILNCISLLSLAAPHPATSTSNLTDPQKGIFFSSFGFRLKTEGTDWIAANSNSDTIFDTIRFEPKSKSNTNAQALLSIRMDHLSSPTNLETYAKKWMREYPNYGFEVLATKSIQLAGTNGLVVDMLQRNQNKQLRQVILQNGKKVAILTCLDNKNSFNKTVLDCNQIIKSFAWDKIEPSALQK